jgi:glycosylphosphatidylinositol deacylase
MALLLAVSTLIPYQGAVLILFLVHALSTLAARPVASPSSVAILDTAAISRFNLYSSIFGFLLWLLPVNAPVLVVWARDLLANWRQPFVGDHNVLRVVGIVAVVVACEGGRSLSPARRDQCVQQSSLTSYRVSSN